MGKMIVAAAMKMSRFKVGTQGEGGGAFFLCSMLLGIYVVVWHRERTERTDSGIVSTRVSQKTLDWRLPVDVKM
jgi:hypothetical protein